MREYMVRLAASCLFLWMAAVPDLKSQKIPIRIPALFLAAALAADLFWPSGIPKRELLSGAVPGAVLLLLSFLLKGKLGEGDGICLLVSGLLTGIVSAVMIAEVALVMAAAAGCFWIRTGRKDARDRIAFVPCLAAAQSLLLFAEAVRAGRSLFWQ